MFVLIWQDWTATVQGEGQRDITCEDCGQRYVYGVTCTGVGVGRTYYFANERGAKREARRNAYRDLDRKLAGEVIPMPCPGCGVYQQSMVRVMRRARYRCPVPVNRLTVWGYTILSLAAIALCASAYIAQDVPWLLGLAVLCGVVWVLVSVICVPYAAVQHLRRMWFDPHHGTTAEQRMAYAQAHAISQAIDSAATPTRNGEILVTDYRLLAPDQGTG